MHAFKPSDLAPLIAQLAKNHHRQLLLLCGDYDWAIKQYTHLFDVNTDKVITLSAHKQLECAQWPEHLHEILGQEFSVALYDGYSGITPNKLAALSGTIKAGGLLILILPELSKLDSWLDPAIKAWLSHGSTTSNSLFLKRWQTLIPHLPVSVLSQKHGANLKIPAAQEPIIKMAWQTQNHIISTLRAKLRKGCTSPSLLSADRGRGKSATLGLLVASMPEQTFIICTIQYRAIKNAFKHLAIELGIAYEGFEKQLANLRYVPPDQVLTTPLNDKIVLVDEAATLPVPILMAIEQRAPQCIFSSTLVGYEGNGRGYTLKFADYLSKKYSTYTQLSLTQPFRYNQNDPLEFAVNRLFALDSNYETYESDTLDNIHFTHLTSQQLEQDEVILQQAFALLVTAHYQTTVNDFRQLLDSPSQHLFAAMQNNRLLGVCLVNIEGRLEKTLHRDICHGSRRPQGHLLPQQLFHVQGQTAFLSASCARIVRIAIAPHLQKRKLGSHLLNFVEQQLSKTVDYFGSSFGCESQLLNFWQNSGYQLVKLGFKKDKASGHYAAMVIKSNKALHSEQQSLQCCFEKAFYYQLANHYRDLPWHLVLKVICQFKTGPFPKPLLAQLRFLLTKSTNLEQYSFIIWQVITTQPKLLLGLSCFSQRLAITLLLQSNTKEWVQQTLSLPSKKQFNIALQALVKELYAQVPFQNE
jgi:tRNA(Met) cytidine acetyltransferase